MNFYFPEDEEDEEQIEAVTVEQPSQGQSVQSLEQYHADKLRELVAEKKLSLSSKISRQLEEVLSSASENGVISGSSPSMMHSSLDALSKASKITTELFGRETGTAGTAQSQQVGSLNLAVLVGWKP